MMRLFARRQDALPFVRARHRIGPGPGGRSARSRARRRARPEAEVLDSRLLMASGKPVRPTRPRRPTWPPASRRPCNPTSPRTSSPASPWRSSPTGRSPWRKDTGLSNVATGSPVQADTRFDIGSVTKTFTALGVLLLYQESQGTSHPLDLNAPISEYLHNNKSFKLPPKWSHITTMELLNMTSGIRDVGGPQPWQAQVKSIAKDPLLYAPGTETSYSNTNYDLLGELIEQWTGEKYGTFIQNQILGPLGMSATQELGGSATVPNQAVGYDAPSTGGGRRPRCRTDRRCTPPPGWSRRPRTWPPI